MKAMLEAAPIAATAWEAQRWHGDVRLQYQSQTQFEKLAEVFGMMAEWRDGVPRAAYHGVVSCLKHAQKCLQSAGVAVCIRTGVLTAGSIMQGVFTHGQKLPPGTKQQA